MIRSFRYLVFRIVVCGSLVVAPQLIAGQSKSALDLVRSLVLLESTPEDASRLLSANTFDVWQSSGKQVFFRYSENIEAYYASGDCLDAKPHVESDFILPDIWKVEKARLVLVSFEPKQTFHLQDLGFDISKFKKERPYRSHKDYFVYFDKSAGIAIRSWGDAVKSVDFFPGKNNLESLCENARISKFYSNGSWRLNKEHKNNIVDFNFPANVEELNVEFMASGSRMVAIEVKAKDSENDVLSYLYRISAGRINSKGNIATWDLTHVSPGKYEIKTAVDDGIGPRGVWLSKWIEVK